MLMTSLKGTATTVFLLGLLALGLGVTFLARADEDHYETSIVEAEALFRDGDLIYSVRMLTDGLTQDEADAALVEFLVSRGYDAEEAYFVPGHDHEGEEGQESEGGVTAEFTNLFAVWSDDDIPVPVRFNSSGSSGLPDLEPAIEHAIAQWNGIQGSDFDFSYSGSSSALTCVGQGPNNDGQNVVRYAELSNSNVLGVTCSSYIGSAFGTGEYVEFDMELNTTVAWDDGQPTDPSSYDVWTTTLHEFGHAMGLNHTQNSNCGGSSPAVMCASLSAGSSVRTLKQDDIDSVLSQYGPEPDPTATSPATSTSTAAATSTSPPPTQPAVPTAPNAVPTSTGTVTEPTGAAGTPAATPSGTPTPGGSPTPGASPTPITSPVPTQRGPFRSFVASVAGGSGGAPADLPPAPTTTPEPTATPVPTAAPTPPATVAAESAVVITTVRYNPPEANDASGEFVELRNTGDAAIQLDGWAIHDEAGEFYTFDEFTLRAGATVRVHNCTGGNSSNNLYTGNCQAVWNNNGDTAYLYDAGNELIHSYSYL